MANPQALWPTGADGRQGVGGVAIGGTTTTPFSNVNGMGGFLGGAIGTAVPVPGAGLIGGAFGTGFDVHRANNQLETLGLPRSVSFGPAAFNNASFGLFGNSTRGQFDEAVTKAYPGLLQALTPAPTMQEAPQSTPSLDYFSAINDYNTVGRLGDIFGGGNGSSEQGGQGGGMGDGGVGSAGGGGAGNGGEGMDGPPGSWARGGPVTRAQLGGPNPPGPDDGVGFLDAGEHVVSAKDVRKLGGHDALRRALAAKLKG